jgi:serine/threonine protein kinase
MRMDSKSTLEPLQPRPADVVLSGRYRIVRELGRGGFGIVFLASDLQLHGRPVVVKAPLAMDPDTSDRVRGRLRAEIEALARIQHPGVVSVLDSGETGSGRPYFVMEYVDGEPLSAWLHGCRQSFESTAEIIGQCGAALGAVHSHGIYHRDLKPENILVSAGQQVKLIDFGIASLADEAPSLTSQVSGTLSYMPPEQLFGHVTVRSDIYSLAVIAYEMLTGSVPFRTAIPAELLVMQREGRYLQANRLRPDLPEQTSQVLDKALSFDAGNRFGSALEFTQRLKESLAGKPAEGSPGRRRVRLRVTTTYSIAAKILHWIAA